MKSKVRLIWIKLHVYFSCFFLPVALLYVATGVLYLFDIKGGASEKFEYEVTLPKGWPSHEMQAKALVAPFIAKYEHGRFPPEYYSEREYISWYGYKQEVLLLPTEDENLATLEVIKHDLWHQFLLIHKGHAGLIFWVFGILLGLSLVFSLVSGVVIAVVAPKFRRSSIVSTTLGLVVLIFLYFIGY